MYIKINICTDYQNRVIYMYKYSFYENINKSTQNFMSIPWPEKEWHKLNYNTLTKT